MGGSVTNNGIMDRMGGKCGQKICADYLLNIGLLFT